MNPAELERALARLVRLAESARSSLDEIGVTLSAITLSMESGAGSAAGDEPGSEAANPTTDPEVAQAKAASK